MKKTLIVVFSVVTAALAVLLVWGIAAGQPSWRTAPERRHSGTIIASYDFAGSEVKELDLQFDMDDVELVPATGDTVRVEHWTNSSPPDAAKLVCRLDNGTLRASTGRWTATDKLVSGWGFISGEPLQSRVTVQVPPDLALPVRFSGGAGNLGVRNLQLGNLEIDCGLGDVQLERISGGSTAVATGAGNIDIQAASLDALTCSTGVGDVNVADAHVARTVRLDSASGNLDFRGSCENYNGEASAGDVFAEVSGAASVAGSTSSGNVDLLCRDAGKLSSVRADTSLGDVTIGLPQNTKISLGYEPGLGQMHLADGAKLEIAGGGIEVDVRTSAGELYLRSV